MYEKITFTLNWVLKRQVLMRMQLTLTIIIFFAMQVGANSVAQHYVTLQQQNISLKEVFKEIKKQTDLTVFYSAKRLNDARKVNINLKNAAIETVLHECLQGLPLTYVIMDKPLVLKDKGVKTPKDNNMQSNNGSATSVFQQQIVTGTLRNASGNVLTGVSVSVAGTASTVATAENGSYQILAKPDATLVFYSVGFQRKEESIR